MRAVGGLLTLLVVVGVAYYLTMGPSKEGGPAATVRQIDRSGIRSDLLALAQAERLHMASSGRFATVEELAASGAVTFNPAARRGYRFEASSTAPGRFEIVARPAAGAGPTFSIDDTMQIVER